MADNLSILDSTGTTKTVRTTDTASVHVPHHIVDSVTGSVTVVGTGTFVTQSVVTNAGTFAVQATQAGTWNITNISGTVSLPTGAATESTLSTLDGKVTACNTGAVVLSSGTVTTVTTLTGSGIAHDSADSGNPHKIGAKATDSVLGGTPVAAKDRTDLFAGTDGVLFVRPYGSDEDSISDHATNTDGSSTAFTGAMAATASQRIYVTDIALCNSSASNVTVDIRDGAAGSVLWTLSVPAGGGNNFHFIKPLRFTANTAVAFDPSAAATTITCSVNGYKSKA